MTVSHFACRAGTAIPPDLSGSLHTALTAIEDALAPANVTKGAACSVDSLRDLTSSLRDAVAAAVPAGLPADDPVSVMLSPDAESQQWLRAQLGGAFMDGAQAELWWAGKEFVRGQTVGNRVGRNEKTKVVAKLQRGGQGAPMREAGVSEEERRAMMAWYFKKQEEEKALAEDRDDRYLTSGWADPRALKTSLNGTGSISWKPGAGSAGGLL